MHEKPKRRTLAVRAADAVGYSHAVAMDEALALHALGNSRRLIDALIKEHGGRIFNTAGDSVLAEFPGLAEAVQCALATQAALHDAEDKVPFLTFRIGISLGEVSVDGANLLGATVNEAARLEAIAPAGGLCISGTVHDAIAEQRGIHWQDLGLRHLKNLVRPVHVFRFVPDGTSPLAGGGRSAKAPSHRASPRQPGRGGRGGLSQ